MLMCSSCIYSGTFNICKNLRFLIYFIVAKLSGLFNSKFIVIFYFHFQTFHDKTTDQLIVEQVVTCGDVETNPGPKNQHQFLYVARI